MKLTLFSRHALPLCLMLVFAPASAQQPLTCVPQQTGALLRNSGITELLADYLLKCTGGVPTSAGQPIPSYTVTLKFNVNVTSRLVSGAVSEALLLIDEPWPTAPIPSDVPKPTENPYQHLCAPQGVLGGACPEIGHGALLPPYTDQPDVFVGMLSAPNQVSWSNVPIDAPGNATRVLRFTNVRVNASSLTLDPSLLAPVTMSVSIAGTPSIAITGAAQTVAYATRSLTYGINGQTVFAQCSSHNPSLLGGVGTAAFDFKAGFQAVSYNFTRRNYGVTLDGTTAPAVYAQNVPGWTHSYYLTETGFYFPALFTSAPNIGLADFGARVQLTFSNVDPGTHIYLPVTINMLRGFGLGNGTPAPVPQGILQPGLRRVEADQYGNSLNPGFTTVPPATTIQGIPVAEVSYVGNTAYAVYEVVDNPTAYNTDPPDTLFGIAVAFASAPSSMPPIGQTAVYLSFAPSGGPWASNPQADATSRIPRFAPSDALLTTFSIHACTAAGDFGGTGRSGVLLYDPVYGAAYTGVSNGNGTYSYAPNLFTPGFDTLRTGDINGDGQSDLVLYNSHTGLAYLGIGNGDGAFAFGSLFWSSGYNFVESGDIEGNAMTDFILYNSSTGTLYTAISTGAGFYYAYNLVSRGFTHVRAGDFTGDGWADLFLYNSGTGAAFLGVGDGTGRFAFRSLFISPGYNLADIGDLNGDGKADVILYNSTNGNAATGISDGIGGFMFTPLPFSTGFTSVRLADHTGDGKADVTLYNKNNGVAYFGTGNGSGSFTFQSLFWSPGYDTVVTQNLNADGKADIILYNSATGTEYSGLSNGNGTFTFTYSLWGPGKMLAR